MVIRQAWVQGSYMGALAPEVLMEGLRIQKRLLGSEVTCDGLPDHRHGDDFVSGGLTRFGSDGMFFHSPLLYFNCSESALDGASKEDILEVVNSNAERRSVAHVRLRFGTVFAGKQFFNDRILAADALVISLFHHPNSTIGTKWDQRAQQLALEAKEHGRFQVFPKGGVEQGNTLYEVGIPISGLGGI